MKVGIVEITIRLELINDVSYRNKKYLHSKLSIDFLQH